MRIFDFVINTVHASAVQINKFICIALGFCVFLRIKTISDAGLYDRDMRSVL